MLMLSRILIFFIIFTYQENFGEANPIAGFVEGAAEGEFPFLVSIGSRREVDYSNPYGHCCGGALITRKHVLTSAHCFHDDETADDYFVYVGSTDLQHSTKYQIQPWIKYDSWIAWRGGHPASCHHFLDNDIAIVEIIGRVSETITLPRISTSSPISFVNQSAITAGWGLFFDDDPPKKLLKTDLRVINHALCVERIHLRSPNMPHDYNLMCTNGAVLFAVLDYGDSGGPLLVRKANGEYEIIGVNEGVAPVAMDWHEIPDQQNSHISVYFYRKFIKAVTRLHYL